MLGYALPGDTVVAASIDRLSRSVAEVTRTIAELGERRITLRALREGARRAAYQHWCEQTVEMAPERQRSVEQHLSLQRDQGLDYGLEL